MIEITRSFRFESAHHLPMVSVGHKCRGMHGHSYVCEVSVCGEVSHMGWVVDFQDITSAFSTVQKELDHHCLNDIVGLENPTSENLCAWIWARLKPILPCLSSVTICETVASRCVYRGGT